MPEIIFQDEEHVKLYNEVLSKMKSKECEYKALAYLMTMDTAIRDHINSVYDFKYNVIKPSALYAPWQTHTSIRITRLAFNLFSDYFYDDEAEDYDETREDCNKNRPGPDRTAVYFTPVEIFSYVSLSITEYMFQAILLRFKSFIL